MAKLYFRYGAMGSAKTANALIVRYNYLEKGQKVILLKPRRDQRNGQHRIESRAGLGADCMYMEEFEQRLKENDRGILADADVILVDEAQFLTASQVELLSDLVDFADIPVLCYGLRTDFQSHLFEGSKRLMEIADEIEQLPTVCWCGKKAHYNTRIHNGQVVREGEQIQLGGNESYVSLCRKHFKQGIIQAPDNEVNRGCN